MHSLKRFSYDADCALFLKVFLGEVSEEVYKDQLRLIFDLHKLFCIMDVIHGNNGRMSKRVIRAGLRAYFGDSKGEDQLIEITKAVDVDCPGAHAEWRALFEEDPHTYNQSTFVEKIQTQLLDERVAYFRNLEDVLYTLTAWKEDCTKVGPVQVARTNPFHSVPDH